MLSKQTVMLPLPKIKIEDSFLKKTPNKRTGKNVSILSIL